MLRKYSFAKVSQRNFREIDRMFQEIERNSFRGRIICSFQMIKMKVHCTQSIYHHVFVELHHSSCLFRGAKKVRETIQTKDFEEFHVEVASAAELM